MFLKKIRRYWVFVLRGGVIFSLLVILIYGGDLLNGWEWPREVISALLGAATVATITYVLLKGQASTENQVEQNKKTFENRLKAYESFLDTLKEVVANNRVDERSEKLLQFKIAAIGMHVDSKEMYIVSKNLKSILWKIKIPEHADGSIWNELMSIVNVLHNSLYSNDNRTMDSFMRKALRNFGVFHYGDSYEVLEFVDCLLSDYKFDSFIAAKCLYYSIQVKKKKQKKKQIPSRIYVTLRIDKNNSNDTYDGIVAVYCNKNHEDLISNIIDIPECWMGPKIPSRSECNNSSNKLYSIGIQNDVKLGVNIIKKAQVYSFVGMEKMKLQSAICDIINYMYPLWADESAAYLRRGNNGELIREIPGKKERKDGTN